MRDLVVQQISDKSSDVLEKSASLEDFKKSTTPTKTNFAQFAEEWFSQCVIGGGLTESQAESDRSLLDNHLLPFFSDTTLDAISGRLIDRYKAFKRVQTHQYGVGYAAKSINNHLSVLHRIFDKAVEYGLLKVNPVSKRAWMKAERTEEDTANWWRAEDERRAMSVLDKWQQTRPSYRLVILLQVMTGLRFSEIRALQIRDVELDIPGLWVRRSMARKKTGTPKNKRARFHVMPRVLGDELRTWVERGSAGQPAHEDLLFVGPKGGPLANNSLNRWYRRLAKEAQIRPISSHGARHTTGSDYAMMGVGQKMIAKLLGHVTTKATERYTHIQVDETRPLVEARWARVVG